MGHTKHYKKSFVLGILFSASILSACNTTAPRLANQTASQPVGASLLAASEPVAAAEEAAPLDPKTVDNLWHRLSLQLELHPEAVQHPRTQKQIQRYLKNPLLLSTLAERSSRYLYHIVESIEERGLPLEMALLPVVESAFDPFAYSPGRAAGLWQFVPITARHVGLKRSWWYDGRRDVAAATSAALDYLEEMNGRFDGDWLLALAAYNAGAGNVNKAIRRNKRLGRPLDYWSLKLPVETQNYIPKLLAIAEIVRNAEQYNLSLPEIPNRPYFTAVHTEGQIDLAQAADIAGISIDEMYRLNPGFNRWATDPSGPHRLLIPVTAADRFRRGLAMIPRQERIHWRRYEVKPGDSLIKVANRFNTDVATIKASNQLAGNTIRSGQMLMLPTSRMPGEHYSLSEQQRRIAAQNRVKSPRHNRIFHRVQSGESMWTIARKHNVSMEAIARWNNLAPKDTIHPGQKLAVWVYNEDRKQTVASAIPAGRDVTRKVGYTVRNGDSLARIAGKFNVRINDIVQWNSINPGKYLQPGQNLTLYVNVTR